jgi:ABC-type multidrug transport system ATPase subunit
MRISLSDAGKRFNRDWIFRHLSFTFESPVTYAIIGPNGSGKSTLLQLIAGAIDPSEGKIEWIADGQRIESDQTYKAVSICAPYLELVEEMTAREFLLFHSRFKPFIKHVDISSILEKIGLRNAADKQIRYYSSGMKQRIKLAQAIFSDTPVILLDEPCTNLDEAGYQLYYSLIEEFCSSRLVIVSSNEKAEYSYCKEIVDISEFKNTSASRSSNLA